MDTRCETIDDCSANGECIHGKCLCDAGYTGEGCSQFKFQPLKAGQVHGYKHYDQDGSQVSSWCGAALLADDGKYHMWSSEMAAGAGIRSWITNSQIVHAVADDPTQPWKFNRKEVVFPVWAHEPSVIRAPTGEYVMYYSTSSFHTQNQSNIPCTGKVCSGRNGVSADWCPWDSQCSLPKEKWQIQTAMSWSWSPEGPWSEPVKLPSPVHHDLNVACVILQNSSLTCLGRQGRIVAKHWKAGGPYTSGNPKHQDQLQAINRGGAARVGVEDPYLWLDKRQTLHTIGHAAGWGFPYGFHAWSRDYGNTWQTYKDNKYRIYGSFVQVDGKSDIKLSRRERPALIFGKDGSPVALSTAVTEGTPCTAKSTGKPSPNDVTIVCPNDYSYSLVQPLGTEASAAPERPVLVRPAPKVSLTPTVLPPPPPPPSHVHQPHSHHPHHPHQPHAHHPHTHQPHKHHPHHPHQPHNHHPHTHHPHHPHTPHSPPPFPAKVFAPKVLAPKVFPPPPPPKRLPPPPFPPKVFAPKMLAPKVSLPSKVLSPPSPTKLGNSTKIANASKHASAPPLRPSPYAPDPDAGGSMEPASGIDVASGQLEPVSDDDDDGAEPDNDADENATPRCTNCHLFNSTIAAEPESKNTKDAGHDEHKSRSAGAHQNHHHHHHHYRSWKHTSAGIEALTDSLHTPAARAALRIFAGVMTCISVLIMLFMIGFGFGKCGWLVKR